MNIMQRFHQFRQHRRLLTVYFNIPFFKIKSTDFAVYICGVSYSLKKKLFILHSFSLAVSLTYPHTLNTFKVAHLHIYIQIHKNIYDKTKRLDLVRNNQLIRGLSTVTVIHVLSTKLVTEKTWGVSFNVVSMWWLQNKCLTFQFWPISALHKSKIRWQK